jgi:RNA polymerase sigma-70 factor (ECF subfamily)
MKADHKELVDRIVGGDRQAFEELVRRFERKIYSVAFKMLGNHLDADEVTQETFVRVYERREELKSIKYLPSFILRIATNYSIDLIRRRQKGFVSVDDLTHLPEVQTELAARITSPEQGIKNVEIMTAIKSAIEKLPPRQKLAIILHDIEGYPKSEIANILQCPQATVRSNLHIARSKLKKWLAKEFK